MGTAPQPLIALIHGVPAAIDPAAAAVHEQMPGARIWNILDDRLIDEVGRQGSVTPELLQRMVRLIDHALLEGADGILITCSLYSFAAAAVETDARRPVPVLGADSAAFHDVVGARPARVLLVASVASALEDSAARLGEVATEHHAPLEIVPVLVTEAREAAATGETARAAELISSALQAVRRDGDAVLFAQYSLSPTAVHVEALTGLTVYTGPARAARELKAAIEHPDRHHHQFYAD